MVLHAVDDRKNGSPHGDDRSRDARRIPTAGVHCLRCNELEDEIRFLHRELGEVTDVDRVARLKERFAPRSRITPKAIQLLLALAAAKGKVRSKDRLLNLLESDGTSKLIEAYVVYLRRAMGADCIKTHRGAGLSLTPQGFAKLAELEA